MHCHRNPDMGARQVAGGHLAARVRDIQGHVSMEIRRAWIFGFIAATLVGAAVFAVLASARISSIDQVRREIHISKAKYAAAVCMTKARCLSRGDPGSLAPSNPPFQIGSRCGVRENLQIIEYSEGSHGFVSAIIICRDSSEGVAFIYSSLGILAGSENIWARCSSSDCNTAIEDLSPL